MPAFRAWAPAIRGQGSSVVPVQDMVTFPGPPSGFSEISMYNYSDLYLVPPSAQVETFEIQFGIPFQLSQDQWTGYLADIQSALAAGGYDLLAYEVDEQPTTVLTIPAQIEWGDPGNPQIIPVPGTFCLPLPSPPFPGPLCATLTQGTTINGFNYRLWCVVYQGTPTGLIRGQGILLIPELIIAALTLVAIYELATGRIDLATLLAAPGRVAAGFASGIGESFTPLAQSFEWPLIALGAVAIIAGVAIPAVSLSGGFTAPGGAGAQGAVGVGQTAAPPPSNGRRR